MDEREHLKREVELLKEMQKRKARRNLRDFLPYVNPKYTMKWFHREIADAVQMVFEGLEKKIMISLPPQHGKSEIVSRDAPAWGLGIDPDLKIVLSSYSATLAGGFNRAVQRIMSGDEYKQLFPDTFLNDERLAKYRGYICNEAL